MIKYIGIRGHRGAGKNSISFLIGASIQYYMHCRNWDNYDQFYERWVQDLLNHPDTTNIWYNLDMDWTHIYFESFGDMPKLTISNILGMDESWMFDEEKKNTILINLRTFEIVDLNNPESSVIRNNWKVYTAKELFELRYNEIDSEQKPRVFRDGEYITLGEMILYFGKYMCQNFLGCNVWVKSLKANNRRWGEDLDLNHTYKIFVDCKFPQEISYIRDKGGVIVKVLRPGNIKEDSDISNELDFDARYDFEVNVPEDLMAIKETIQELTLKIIEK